jgi:hypothetical protein
MKFFARDGFALMFEQAFGAVVQQFFNFCIHGCAYSKRVVTVIKFAARQVKVFLPEYYESCQNTSPLVRRLPALVRRCARAFSTVNVHSLNVPLAVWPNKSGRAGFTRPPVSNHSVVARIARFLRRMALHDSPAEKDFV